MKRHRILKILIGTMLFSVGVYAEAGDQAHENLTVPVEQSAKFKTSTKKPADQIKTKLENDTAVFSVFSQSGIGGGTITLTKGKWPKHTVVRLHLRGLESLSISNGKVKLMGSVLSHSGNTKRLDMIEDGQKRKPGTEIRVLDATGKTVKGLPGRGGYFEVKLPKSLLEGEPKSLELGWIDFFRG